MTSPNHFHTFAGQDILTSTLSTTIISLLHESIAKNGRASLMVSGGSTPIQLFKALSVSDLQWSKVDIGLVDERWVAPTDPDSNEHLVRSHLLQNNAAAANFTGMKNSAQTASHGELECTAAINTMHHPFDVLILGMGNDGHTASLFPGAEKLSQTTDMKSNAICMGIAPVTAPHERMTLTLPAILKAKNIFLHITGQNKKDVFTSAQTNGPAEEMPIRFILQQQQENHINFNIYWAP